MYQSSTVIEADPSTVWAVLTDLPAWPSWESAIVRTEGRIEAGSRVKLWPEINPDRAFALKVTELEPERAMTFESGMPLGLFRGVRTYRLAQERGGTRFDMREEYSGPLAGLITKTIPDLQPSFDTFARGLKARAESRTSP